MASLRAVITVLVLSLFFDDTNAQQNALEISACARDNVVLQCPCSEGTKTVAWQTDDEKILAYYNRENSGHEQKPDKLYQNRTQLNFSENTGHCSLILQNVTPSDQKTYICYCFEDKKLNYDRHIFLKVNDSGCGRLRQVEQPPTGNPLNSVQQNAGLSVGVPMIVIILLVGGLILALWIKRCRRTQTAQFGLEGMSGKPMIEHSNV